VLEGEAREAARVRDAEAAGDLRRGCEYSGVFEQTDGGGFEEGAGGCDRYFAE